MQKILNEIKNNKQIYITLLFVLILGTFLRLYNLGENSFVADEFLDVNATYGYFKTGEWQAWDFNLEQPSVRDNQASDERAWVYRWQVAQIYRFLEPVESNIRLVSALWGIFTILILYLVTFSLTKNRWTALITAFLFSVSVPALEINRKIRMYSMFAPVYLLLSYVFFQFLETSKKKTKNLFQSFFNFNWWYFVPVLLLGLLSLNLHQLTGNLALVIFLYYLIMFFVDYKKTKFNRYILYVFSAIFLAVSFWFFFKEQFEFYWKETLTFFEDHYSYFYHINFNFESALIGWTLILVGTGDLLRRRDNFKSGLWVVCNFFLVFLLAIFVWKRNVGPQYIFFVQSFTLILAASGISALAKFLSSSFSFHLINIFNQNNRIELKKERRIFLVVLAFFVFVPNYTYFLEENNTFHSTSHSENPNYRNVFEYVKINYKEGDVMITRNFRNYYYSGDKFDIPVFDFGSERSEEFLEKEGKKKKITLDYVKQIVSENPTGWVVISDNDETFFEKETLDYFERNFVKIKSTDSLLVKGNVNVYRWKEQNF